jgi:1,2-dihydroxy-3-keto-5-methylthiopentene dioxygenase
MRAYYYDNVPGDQRLLHDSGLLVSAEELEAIGVSSWSIPIDDEGKWQARIDEVAQERGYKNRDVINVTKEGLGDAYEAKIKLFFEEHMHEDEEIRYILSGSGFFDVREHATEAWVRIKLAPGDLLVLPAGIYHRFTLDETNAIKAMRLFKDEPKWTPYNRGVETENNPYRLKYVDELERRLSNNTAAAAA